jgi:hypothetical protein
MPTPAPAPAPKDHSLPQEGRGQLEIFELTGRDNRTVAYDLTEAVVRLAGAARLNLTGEITTLSARPSIGLAISGNAQLAASHVSGVIELGVGGNARVAVENFTGHVLTLSAIGKSKVVIFGGKHLPFGTMVNDESRVEVSGSASVYLDKTGALNITVAGSGVLKIQYAGGPLNIDVAGNGSVEIYGRDERYPVTARIGGDGHLIVKGTTYFDDVAIAPKDATAILTGMPY